jgi:hypothetical protein
MDEDVDEVELFEHGGYVCAVRTMHSKFDNKNPWHQGLVYLKGGATKRSNWYLKPEDAIKMARVMVNQEKNGAYR